MQIQLTITMVEGDEPLAKTPHQIALATRKLVGATASDVVSVQVSASASLYPTPPVPTGTPLPSPEAE